MLAFTHLIPHSVHTLEAASISPSYAFQATVVGYLVVFAVEKLLFDSHAIIHTVMEEGPTIHRPSLESEDGDSSGVPKVEGTEIDSSQRPRSPSTVSQQSAVVLLLAMGVHSLFETVALGMAPDRTSALIMATSVALHQPAESLALLVTFLKTSMERKSIRRFVELFYVTT